MSFINYAEQLAIFFFDAAALPQYPVQPCRRCLLYRKCTLPTQYGHPLHVTLHIKSDSHWLRIQSSAHPYCTATGVKPSELSLVNSDYEIP